MKSFRNFLLLLFFFYCSQSFSQFRDTAVFGEPTPADFEMKTYPQDPEAAGVVLFESAKNYVAVVDDYVKLIKEVHIKIKVLDAGRFGQAIVEIPYYSEKNRSETVAKITAITHNGPVKTFLNDNSKFVSEVYPKWSVKKFTFPNVKDGSILEYTYRVESNYFSNFDGWDFQGELPKIYTELHTEIPGNFSYNRALYGNLKLDINEATIKKTCFSLPGYDVDADCEVAIYAMRHVPAIKKESHMLSEDNYIARMSYELVEYTGFSGGNEVFTREWKDADNRFEYDKDMGRQLKFSGYFKDELPASVLGIADDLEKAKAVYYYIQQRMAWNGNYGIYQDVDVKEAFKRGSGNSSEINLALINALDAAGFDAKIMLIATRDFAQPTKQYPVMNGFTFVLAFLVINNEKYILDATDKFVSFGFLPHRDLNGQGRVMDFKKGSYWEPITPNAKNMHYVNMQLTANEAGNFSGKINEVSTGLVAMEKRKHHYNLPMEEILRKKQSQLEHIELSNLEIENSADLEQPFKENYNITINDLKDGDILFLYPFLMGNYFNENPFKATTRKFPIDFGHPITNNYLVSIDVTDQYEIVKVPANRLLKLPENDGEISVIYDVSGTKVNIRLNVKLNNPSFAPEAYKTLQEFFSTLIKIQNEEPIELKKI